MSGEFETAIPEMPGVAPRLYGIAALVAAIVLVGLWLILRFTAADLARDVQAWQEKLNLIAESRAAEINGWVEGNVKELQTLSDNPSLQLYMTELQMQKAPDAGDEPAQKTYLRNLLLFTAQRAGFGSGGNAASIPADVQPESKSGLAIIDAGGQPIVSTPMLAAVRDRLLEYAKQPASAEPALIDISKDNDGTPMIGFIAPVFSIQGDRTAGGQIGRIIAMKTVGDNLFGLLKYPGATEKTLESVLVRTNDGKLEYISPLEDGTATLGKQTPLDPAASAEAALVQTIGNFVSDQKDYRERTVLATSRAIAGTPWTLIVKIDREEALAQSGERRAGMAVFFFLIIASIVLIVVAVWWHAHSRRSLMLSGYFRALAAQAKAQERLLRLVADHQPEPIYIVDAGHSFRFANRQAAAEANMAEDSMAGKTLADVRGYARADHIAQQCDQARKDGRITYDVQRIRQKNNEEKIVRSAYVPLAHIPLATLPEPTPGVLVVEQDISEVVQQRERRLEIQRQLVEMLIRLVDKRDPFAANHSQLVADIAQEIAVGMGLDEVTAETAKTAASLMNIGKIVVPAELLTKTKSLSADEKRTIHDSMNAAAELLAGIRFDGPVADAIRQWQEKWDGTGPLGLKGETILMPARIIAVANTFVGMISPRSWRTALTVEAANKFLLDQSGSHFDRRVVITLINYVENQSGRAWLKTTLDGQKKAA